MSENFQTILIEQEYKFEYSFATLCFAILGLSIQFSPNYGQIFAPLLVVAWLLFLGSAILAGYRIVYRLVTLRINYQVISNEDHIRKTRELVDAKKINPMRKVLGTSGAEKSLEELNDGIAKAQKNLEIGGKAFEKINKRLGYFYWTQMVLFLSGLTCNFIFVSVNFLCKS